jgi:hypothetical protein
MGGGWRQLDDARSKMCVEEYENFMMMSMILILLSILLPCTMPFADAVHMPFWHNFSTGISSWSAPDADCSGVDRLGAACNGDALSPAACHRYFFTSKHSL